MAASATIADEPGSQDKTKGRVEALYCGGTLCTEAELVFKRRGLQGHRFIDLGDEKYTRGRPHPMIDPEIRNAHIAAALADPAVGVILVDVVLGFGSHPDPAGVLLDSEERKDHCRLRHRHGRRPAGPVAAGRQAARCRRAGRAVERARRGVGRLPGLLRRPRHRDDSGERVPAGGVAHGVEPREIGVQVGRLPGGQIAQHVVQRLVHFAARRGREVRGADRARAVPRARGSSQRQSESACAARPTQRSATSTPPR